MRVLTPREGPAVCTVAQAAALQRHTKVWLQMFGSKHAPPTTLTAPARVSKSMPALKRRPAEV